MPNNLEGQIHKDYIQAMKERNALRSSTLSFLRAQLKNVRIEKKVDQLDDVDVLAVIKKQIKQRQDSIDQYTQGKREDLVAKETKESEILRSYLPQEISQEELKSLVADAIKESGARSMKDMGQVMKVILPKVAGRADNKVLSELVKNTLSTM